MIKVPNRDDTFKLIVSPPFGEENLMMLASTSPLGDIESQNAGAVYLVNANATEVAKRTRKLKMATRGKRDDDAEFTESNLSTMIVED